MSDTSEPVVWVPGCFDRRAVDRAVQRVPLPDDGGAAWAIVLYRTVQALA
jgi:hypothetical protein